MYIVVQTDGLVQQRRNSSALAMELRLPCTDQLKYTFVRVMHKDLCTVGWWCFVQNKSK